eukprot:8748097-Lingulodinium_polyedra.AAC.1
MGGLKNALAVSAWLLDSPQNERVCLIIVEMSRPLMQWHTEQTRTLRHAEGNEDLASVVHVPLRKDATWLHDPSFGACISGGPVLSVIAKAAKEWITKMVHKPGFTQHLHDIVAKLTSAAAMSAMKFVTTCLEAKGCTEGDTILEDDFADIQFNFTWGLISQRCRRGLWLTEGWPNKLYSLL